MEIQDILALVQAVADNGLTELKVDDGNVKLSLKKEHPVVNVVAGNTGAGSAGAGMQVAGVQMPDFGSFGAAGALAAGTVAAAQETGNAVANTGAPCIRNLHLECHIGFYLHLYKKFSGREFMKKFRSYKNSFYICCEMKPCLF